MKITGATNKEKLTYLLLLCLQYGTPKGENYSLDDLRKKSKFQGMYDYKIMRTCIDLIQDTEYAIIDFAEYQLSRTRARVSQGEIYLRLYGILNAIYLQRQAILQVAELVKYPGKKNLQKELDSHRILEIRNIAGSHTVNFITDKSQSFKSKEGNLNHFRLTQCELKEDASNLTIVDCFGKYEQINLKELVYDYNSLSERLLTEIIEKYLKTLCKNDPYTLSRFLETITDVRSSPTNYTKFEKFKDYLEKRIRKAKKLIKDLNL